MAKKKAVAIAIREDEVFRNIYQPILNPRRNASSDTEMIQWMLERKLMEISMNRFEWTGLPDEIDIRWMEMSLNFYALAVFFRDDEFGKYLALRGSPSGNLNLIGNPTEFRVYGTDTYQKDILAVDCVPIWANYMRMPDWDIIRIYAARIANMDRTIEINAMNARHPKVLKTTANTRLSIGQIRRQLEEGASAIELDVSSIDPADAIEVLDLEGDPMGLMNLHIVRTREWSECMTMLGINNSNQDKKERLTAAETAGNDDVIATIRATNLKARQIACEQINKKYKMEVSVDYTTDMKTAITKDVNANDQANPDGQKVGA